MLVYEVNLDVDAAIGGDYLDWLDGHVREILALPGFTGASAWRVHDPAPPPGRLWLCVQYALQDEAALERYLREDAPRLRADGLARFGGRFNATRRVLHPLDRAAADPGADDARTGAGNGNGNGAVGRRCQNGA